MVVIGTMLTRFLPFIIFPSGKPTPQYVQYLGKVLPAAAIALLVIYSIKDISLLSGNESLPALIAIIVIIGLHIWKRSMLLSIAAGTLLYMFLIQVLFH